MKAQHTRLTENIEKQTNSELLLFLELGNHAGQKGNDQTAIDYYIKGLQIARELKDKPRIQQLSNLILTYL